MADAVGLAVSIIAIVELSAKISSLCLEYSTAVKNAKADIARLRSRVDGLTSVLKAAITLLDGKDSQALSASQKLIESLEGCATELTRVEKKLSPGKTKKAMRRFGLRALKWPFDSKEICDILSSLERYEQTITLGLQVDQTTLLLDIRRRVDDLSIQPEDDVSTPRKPCFCVPFERDPDFVDRPDIMKWVMEQYQCSPGRMALVGMGGFGKSQIAIEFAHHIRETCPQTSVFWVHASSKPRFREAYQSIAERLRLPRRNDPSVNVLELVRDWLQRDDVGSWLMVLDNADDVSLFYDVPRADSKRRLADANPILVKGESLLAPFLPKRRDGIILITSRSLDVAERLTGNHKAVYRISVMDNTESLELFRNKLESDFDHEAAADLINALGCTPLAITQAAAYINRRAPRVSVRTYLEDFRKSNRKKETLLNSDFGDLRRDDTVANSVVTTWQLTFEQICREKPSAADLLSFMSFFNPQGIPEFVLHSYRADTPPHEDKNSDDSNDDFEDDVDILRGYSLVSAGAKGDACEMHPLVQVSMQIWLSRVHKAEEWKRKFIWAMSEHFPFGEFENWSICRLLLPHVESILDEEPPEECQEHWVTLLNNCARYFCTTGSYDTAEKLIKKALEKELSILGKEHPSMLSSMSNLASTYRDQGRWKEAEKLRVQVLEIRKKVLGEEHPDTLSSMGNLASIYWDQGLWKEAEELEVRVMEIKKKVIGEENPATLFSMGNLASIYKNQGRWKEAEELEVWVMAATKKALGKEHPATLFSMGNLASIYKDQGRWKEAEELEVRVMETRKKALGKEHPATLFSMGNLASIYKDQGRWKEAEELEVRVMEIRKKALGKEHPATLFSMGNLASIYKDQGRWKEAEELEVRVMEIKKKVIGEENPDTLTSMNNLAFTWKELGRFQDALILMQRCIKIESRVLGPNHPRTVSSSKALAKWQESVVDSQPDSDKSTEMVCQSDTPRLPPPSNGLITTKD
ncbi:hypothetical protein F5B19DRAFT_496110 [Rostrohypoxylon terebratum]|nr:hypothetical protein F5B19DRAFT_496110 [Rostrohypoxylon terebratum]